MKKINDMKKNGILGSLLNRSSSNTSNSKNNNMNISNANISNTNVASKQNQNKREQQQSFFAGNNDHNNFLRHRSKFNNL